MDLIIFIFPGGGGGGSGDADSCIDSSVADTDGKDVSKVCWTKILIVYSYYNLFNWAATGGDLDKYAFIGKTSTQG